jgi:uncharacterized repeat protein (TIGR01451 family)
MKKFVLIRSLLFLALCLLACGRAAAQGPATDWALSVSASPLGNVNPNTQITYVINITNLTGATLNTTVTDTFPSSAIFVSATNNLGATTSNSPGQVLVFLPGFSTVPLQITVVLEPTVSGFFTNLVAIGSPLLTNSQSTNIVTQVNTLTTTLNASITLPTVAVLSNDWITYDVTVNNPGSNSASSVVLSNTLPAGVTNVISVSPASPAYTLSNGVMVFNLGTVAAKASDNFAITIQPTFVGTNFFVASVSSSRSQTATTTNTLPVAPFDTTQLAVTNASNTNYNSQIGLLEQTITVTNIGTNAITGLRVVVAGLPTNLPYQVAYDAVGTNNGNPFYEYDGTTLATNQSVTLTLEYARAIINVSNLVFTAVPVSPPTNSLTSGTSFAITNIFKLQPSGNILIEFSATKGGTYVIQYTDNIAMTNWMQAQPPVVAPANEVQWIDFGPPETISTPATTNPRFYRVIQTH